MFSVVIHMVTVGRVAMSPNFLRWLVVWRTLEAVGG
jgi:hypothetical protein